MALLKFLKVPKIKASTVTKYAGNDPLRILFCGSDTFSVASLEKLHRLYRIDKDRIASIDVVCRPGKPVGRGLKTVHHVPISKTAAELGLPLHEIDTFTGWKPPKPEGNPINLIVAVSFGLFVPPRILEATKYGGLNVHPSMLPDFYGPAPLHHTLLTGSTYTGVTVQTLHPKHFDRGTILLQHPSPGIKHNCRNVEDLSQSLGTKGGNMLVDCIRNRMYLYGSHVVPENTANEPRILGKHAPKITAADRFIDWTAWSGEEIRRRHEVIGPLWSLVKVDNDSQNLRRIIWSVGFESTFYRPDHELPVGQPIIIGYPSPSRVVYVRAYDGQVLTVRELKIEGGLQAQPFEAARKARINERETDQKDGPLFRGQLLSSLPDQYRNPEPSSQRTDHCDKTT